THATTGVHTKSIDAGASLSTLENGGAGLAGEQVQSSLPVGYQWTVVQNNTLASEDFLVIANAGAINTSYYNGSVYRELNYSEGTAIGFNPSVSVSGNYGAGVR